MDCEENSMKSPVQDYCPYVDDPGNELMDTDMENRNLNPEKPG